MPMVCRCGVVKASPRSEERRECWRVMSIRACLACGATAKLVGCLLHCASLGLQIIENLFERLGQHPCVFGLQAYAEC